MMSSTGSSPGEAFRVDASGDCVKCGRKVQGWIAFDDETRIVDSGGFVVFADGLTCDACLGEADPAGSA